VEAHHASAFQIQPKSRLVFRISFTFIFNRPCRAVSSGSEPNHITNEEFRKKVTYELSIKDNLISLNAEAVILKKILEDIGQKLNVEVFASIPAEDKITIQFANLPLEESLKKFKTNYAIVTDPKDKNGNIRRIVVVPEGQQTNLSLKDVKNGIGEDKPLKPEPFKLEFDPSKYN
jgi:hypothetical protein